MRFEVRGKVRRAVHEVVTRAEPNISQYQLTERITEAVMKVVDFEETTRLVSESELNQSKAPQAADPWTNERYS